MKAIDAQTVLDAEREGFWYVVEAVRKQLDLGSPSAADLVRTVAVATAIAVRSEREGGDALARLRVEQSRYRTTRA